MSDTLINWQHIEQQASGLVSEMMISLSSERTGLRS